MKYLNNIEFEAEVCNNYFNNIKNKDSAILLKCSKDTIYDILKKYNLHNANVSQEEMQDIINYYNELNSTNLPNNYLKILVKKFNRSAATILSILKTIRTPKKIKKYEINENYFENIDCANKAYWLGFIAADGNISRNCLHIGIHADDVEHLYKFKSDIEATNPVNIKMYISKGKPSKIARIDIYNQKIVKDLSQHGINPNKTHNISWDDCVKNIPTEFIIDFIRGFFDGDGSWTKCGENQLTFKIGIADENFAKRLQFWLFTHLNLKITKIANRRNTFFTIEKGGRHNIQKIYNAFYYENSFYMQRKKLKVERFLLKIF